MRTKSLICIALFSFFAAAPLSPAAYAKDGDFQMYREIEGMFQVENFAKVIKAGNDFLITAPESIYKDKVLFFIGISHLKNKDFTEAVHVLADLKKKRYISVKIDWVIQSLADAYFELEKYDAALGEYTELIEKYPDSDVRFLAYYKGAVAARSSGRYGTAGRYFRDLIDKFPESEEAMKASEELAKLPKDEELKETLPQGRYAVQIGSFQYRENAEKLKNELSKKDLICNITSVIIDKKVYYRLRTGYLPGKAEADRLAEKLIGEYFLPARVFED